MKTENHHIVNSIPLLQVDQLTKELEAQHKEKEALEARANQAEKKIDVLLLKIDKVSC